MTFDIYINHHLIFVPLTMNASKTTVMRNAIEYPIIINRVPKRNRLRIYTALAIKKSLEPFYN